MKILLSGFMGAGKTHLMRQLEGTNGSSDWQFIDLDSAVEQAAKKDIGSFVSQYGWDQLRKMEFRVLQELLQGTGQTLISLGGGTLNRNVLDVIKTRQDCRIVWINIPFEKCYERIKNDKQRPLVEKGRVFLHDLYEARLPFYNEADLILDEELLNGLVSMDQLRETLPD